MHLQSWYSIQESRSAIELAGLDSECVTSKTADTNQYLNIGNHSPEDMDFSAHAQMVLPDCCSIWGKLLWHPTSWSQMVHVLGMW